MIDRNWYESTRDSRVYDWHPCVDRYHYLVPAWGQGNWIHAKARSQSGWSTASDADDEDGNVYRPGGANRGENWVPSAGERWIPGEFYRGGWYRYNNNPPVLQPPGTPPGGTRSQDDGSKGRLRGAAPREETDADVEWWKGQDKGKGKGKGKTKAKKGPEVPSEQF